MSKVKKAIRRRQRYVLIVTEIVLGSLFITGCQSGTSVAAQVQQLIQQYPWLSRLGLAFLEGLVGGLGWNLGALLHAAAAALLAGQLGRLWFLAITMSHHGFGKRPSPVLGDGR